MIKANPKAVGGFVLGAIALAIVAVIVFGSGKLFSERETFVVFFSGSLQGLRVGAPVQLRGVQIGTVTDISVQVRNDEEEFVLPVLIEIDISQIKDVNGRPLSENADRVEVGLDRLIELGLRAQLVSQSFVTGQQTVQLDLLPDSEIHLEDADLKYPQIPTTPSTISRLKSSADTLMERTGATMDELKKVLSQKNRENLSRILENGALASGEIGGVATKLEGVVDDLQGLVATVKDAAPQFGVLLDEGRETLISYQAVATRAERLLAENEEGITQAIVELRTLEGKLARTADTATRLLSENRQGIRDFTDTGLYEFTNLAVDSQAAVEQFRRVLEEMERDPARFFFGQPGRVEVK